jgi:cytochrome P450 PksS
MIKIADLARPEFKANPYPLYSRLRKESAVCPTKFLGMPTWLVTRYDTVVMVLKDERYVKDWLPRTKWIHRFSGPVTRHMLNKDAPDHTRLRTLVHKAFTPSLVERLRQRIQTCCDELLNDLSNKGSMDLMRGYALPLPLTIIAELLGIPAEYRNGLHSLSRSSLSASSTLGVLRAFPDQRLLVRRLRKLITERRRNPDEDLITSLIQAEEAGDKLNEEELVGTIVLLLVAGYETTVNLIGNGVLALLQYQDQRQMLRENRVSPDSAIEELLRYTSPLDIASLRFACEDIQIDSVTIPQGHAVIAVLGSANHDESQFREPETLDLSRDPNRHVAFGQGVHFCLGAPLARLEGQIALTTLFQCFPNLRLSCPPEKLCWRKSLIVRGLEELPVKC